MRRLVWVGVGVALTVVAVRYGRRALEAYVPAGTGDVVVGVGRAARAATGFRSELRAGMAEREAQLRRELLGDVDVEALRGTAGERVEALREAFGARRRAGAHVRTRPDWADGPTDDPDDDGEAAFF